MPCRLTRQAEADIMAIADYGICHFGEKQARQYYDRLFSLFELIAANPLMAWQRLELNPPVRIHPYRSHLIVYTVEDNGTVLVIRLRHAQENWTEDEGDG